MFKYTISTIAKQPKDNRINFENAPDINGVQIKPLDKDHVELSIELEGTSDQQILEDARKRIESIIYALILTFGKPFIFENPRIQCKDSVSLVSKELMLSEHITITEKAEIEVKPATERFAKVAEFATKLESISPDAKEALSRLNKWFYKAMVDDDPIDRFIQLYIALEIIGACKYPNDSFSKRVKKVLVDQLADSNLAEKITNLRGSLFHFGLKEEEARQYIPHMTEAVQKSIFFFSALENL
ncbi:MAG: hypothetical protein QXD19_00225 [Candidatus Bathyarchaeia archaeon]